MNRMLIKFQRSNSSVGALTTKHLSLLLFVVLFVNLLGSAKTQQNNFNNSNNNNNNNNSLQRAIVTNANSPPNGQCQSGYHLEGNNCQPNQCFCQGGNSKFKCALHQSESCVSCVQVWGGWNEI